MWALGCILYEIWTQDSSFVTESFGMATKLGKDREMINRLEDIAIVQLLGIISRPLYPLYLPYPLHPLSTLPLPSLRLFTSLFQHLC